MGTRLIFLVFAFFLFALLQTYIYHALIPIPESHFAEKLFFTSFTCLNLLVAAGFVFQFLAWQKIKRPRAINFMIGLAFSIFLCQLILCGFMIAQDLIRLVIALVDGIYSWIVAEKALTIVFPSRSETLTLGILGGLGLLLSFMIYGITKGKYRFVVKELDILFEDLPKAFDGFRIVHISDIHSGSFDNYKAVKKGVDMIEAQNPDIVLFSGDLVNSHKDEIDPFIQMFSELKPKFGKYAVLGNHDYYGLYAVRDKADKTAYWNDFLYKFSRMGFDLLINNHRYIQKSGERICLAGVENWGSGHWFQKYGDLDKALDGVSTEDFIILLSHDPTHWDQKILLHQKHIQLTLSGHTHAMQFGIDLPGFRWSPAQIRYKRWSGLYEESKKFLYVNRGFGFLGFPGRVGMWPEITVINLKAEMSFGNSEHREQS